MRRYLFIFNFIVLTTTTLTPSSNSIARSPQIPDPKKVAIARADVLVRENVQAVVSIYLEKEEKRSTYNNFFTFPSIRVRVSNIENKLLKTARPNSSQDEFSTISMWDDNFETDYEISIRAVEDSVPLRWLTIYPEISLDQSRKNNCVILPARNLGDSLVSVESSPFRMKSPFELFDGSYVIAVKRSEKVSSCAESSHTTDSSKANYLCDSTFLQFQKWTPYIDPYYRSDTSSISIWLNLDNSGGHLNRIMPEIGWKSRPFVIQIQQERPIRVSFPDPSSFSLCVNSTTPILGTSFEISIGRDSDTNRISGMICLSHDTSSSGCFGREITFKKKKDRSKLSAYTSLPIQFYHEAGLDSGKYWMVLNFKSTEEREHQSDWWIGQASTDTIWLDLEDFTAQ